MTTRELSQADAKEIAKQFQQTLMEAETILCQLQMRQNYSAFYFKNAQSEIQKLLFISQSLLTSCR